MPDTIDPEERRMIDQKIEAGEVTKVPEGTVAYDLRPKTKEEISAGAWKRTKGAVSPQVVDRRKKVRELVESKKTTSEIAEACGVTYQTIHNDLVVMGLKAARARQVSKGTDRAAQAKRKSADKARKVVKDRRRFKDTPVPLGKPTVAPADVEGTIFPTRVFEADGTEPVLKDGCNNSKIGGDVLVGRLEGAMILTLTLEERATCPRSCGHWRTCYGNQMQYARRWQPGKDLEDQLRAELDAPAFADSTWHMGMGYSSRANTEDCWLGTTGNPKRLDAGVRELIIAPRREHSRKPDEFFPRAERLFAGPRIELFSREPRPGWDTWGNEARKFEGAA